MYNKTLIPDIGRGRTKFYFGPERYKHFVNFAGIRRVGQRHEQAPGEEFARSCSTTNPRRR
jgi:hypothetical protein